MYTQYGMSRVRVSHVFQGLRTPCSNYINSTIAIRYSLSKLKFSTNTDEKSSSKNDEEIVSKLITTLQTNNENDIKVHLETQLKPESLEELKHAMSKVNFHHPHPDSYFNIDHTTSASSITSSITAPSASSLRAVFLNNLVPFMGFGFADNVLMIVAGDYIDYLPSLAISTMVYKHTTIYSFLCCSFSFFHIVYVII